MTSCSSAAPNSTAHLDEDVRLDEVVPAAGDRVPDRPRARARCSPRYSGMLGVRDSPMMNPDDGRRSRAQDQSAVDDDENQEVRTRSEDLDFGSDRRVEDDGRDARARGPFSSVRSSRSSASSASPVARPSVASIPRRSRRSSRDSLVLAVARAAGPRPVTTNTCSDRGELDGQFDVYRHRQRSLDRR